MEEWRGDNVDSAVRMAAGDVAKGRLPWLSFKLPYTWSEMAAGKGDVFTQLQQFVNAQPAAVPYPMVMLPWPARAEIDRSLSGSVRTATFTEPWEASVPVVS